MANPPSPPQPARESGPQPGTARAPGKKSPARRVVLGLLVVAVIAVLAAVGRLVTDDPDVAAVGDCVAGSTAAELEVVDCSDATAEYKVEGKVDGKTQSDFRTSSSEICKPFQGTTRVFWKGTVGGNGYVLCLAPNK